LACLFASKYEVIGFDIDVEKIKMLNAGIDYTNELAEGSLCQTNLIFSNEQKNLKQCDIVIMAVPTDIDEYNLPDLRPLKKASEMIGKCLQKGMIVVFESTVYPGLTEEECIPILEKFSGLV
jgi:UDP-N-acetyl-D-galactosamine dehydrogenase